MSTETISLPLSPEAFAAEYFERSLLHLPAAIPQGSYTWDDFSRDFYAIEPGLGLVRLYKVGLVDKSQYMHGSERDAGVAYDFQPDALRQILASGGSMVVNRFDKTSAFVGHLCRRLASFSGNTTVGNAYATQGGTGTFGKHWDTHCVFATQLIGAKRWKVFRPTFELPLAFQTSKTHKDAFEGEVVFDADLQQGDVLYVPRGWWHEATPLEGVPSLHIAVGVHTPKVHDYIRWVLTNKMPAQRSHRESLTADPAGAEALASALQLLTEACQSVDSLTEFRVQQHAAANVKPRVDFVNIFQSQPRVLGSPNPNSKDAP